VNEAEFPSTTERLNGCVVIDGSTGGVTMRPTVFDASSPTALLTITE